MVGTKRIYCHGCKVERDPDYFLIYQLASTTPHCEIHTDQWAKEYEAGKQAFINEEISYDYLMSQSRSFQEGYKDAWHNVTAPTGGYDGDSESLAWEFHTEYMPQEPTPISLSQHIQFAAITFALGMSFATVGIAFALALLAVPEDVDAVWGMIR